MRPQISPPAHITLYIQLNKTPDTPYTIKPHLPFLLSINQSIHPSTTTDQRESQRKSAKMPYEDALDTFIRENSMLVGVGLLVLLCFVIFLVLPYQMIRLAVTRSRAREARLRRLRRRHYDEDPVEWQSGVLFDHDDEDDNNSLPVEPLLLAPPQYQPIQPPPYEALPHGYPGCNPQQEQQQQQLPAYSPKRN